MQKSFVFDESYHADLHVPFTVEAVAVGSHDDDIGDWLGVADAGPGVVPVAEVDEVEPHQDKVQVGQLCLHIFNILFRRLPYRNNGRRVEFLSKVEYNNIERPTTKK